MTAGRLSKSLRVACRLLPVVIVAGLGVPAIAAGAPRVAATTTVTFTRSASSDVVITQDTWVIFVDGSGHSPNFTISGRGRIVGIAVVSLSDPRNVLLALRINGCEEPGCSPKSRIGGVDYVGTVGFRMQPPGDPVSKALIPAGRYRLYAIADGAPVSVTMRGFARTGRTQLRPARPIRPRWQHPAALIDGPVQPVYSAGGDEEIHSRTGLMVNVLRYDARPYTAGITGACYSLNAPPAFGLYQPACDNGSPPLILGAVSPAFSALAYGAGITLVPGRWYQGVYWDAVVGPTDIYLTALWLDFD